MISNKIAYKFDANMPWQWIFFLVTKALALEQTTKARVEEPTRETIPRNGSFVRTKNSLTALRLAPQCKIKALVVDDHPINRDKLLHVLDDIGVATDFVKSSAEAVKKARTQLPDIIFMDMRMMLIGGK